MRVIFTSIMIIPFFPEQMKTEQYQWIEPCGNNAKTFLDLRKVKHIRKKKKNHKAETRRKELCDSKYV